MRQKQRQIPCSSAASELAGDPGFLRHLGLWLICERGAEAKAIAKAGPPSPTQRANRRGPRFGADDEEEQRQRPVWAASVLLGSRKEIQSFRFAPLRPSAERKRCARRFGAPGTWAKKPMASSRALNEVVVCGWEDPAKARRLSVVRLTRWWSMARRPWAKTGGYRAMPTNAAKAKADSLRE